LTDLKGGAHIGAHDARGESKLFGSHTNRGGHAKDD
jgi:hypothetical protein